jgi:adenosylhomocysteine nucleosidase
MKLMVLAAFPQELKHVLKNMKAAGKEKKCPLTIYIGSYGPHDIVAVQTGMGPFETDGALEDVFKEHDPDYILSIGFGGALYDRAKAGELVWGKRCMLCDKGNGIDQKEGLNAAENSSIYMKLRGKLDIKEGTVITITERTAKPVLRKMLPKNIPFPVCDMETFHIARLALKRGVPFFAIRSITDRADEEIPEELFGVCDEEGNFKFTRALGILVKRPALIPGSVRLGSISAGASKNLWQAVKSLIEVLE